MSIALPILPPPEFPPDPRIFPTNQSECAPNQNHSPAPPPAPAHAIRSGSLIDSHSRTIRDLRLSITDRCNFRCTYCMDPDFRYMPKRELLSLDEYTRLVRICTTLGIEKVRITGGEPTLYPNLLQLIRNLSALNIRDLAMTTNGSLLTEQSAAQWREAGLHRITLSIDSLKPERLRSITRSDTTVESTIRAIHAAKAAGLSPIKVNAVIMRGVNDDEVADFADFALEHEIDMRLIEFMPLDSSRAWKREHVFDANEMLEAIRKRHDLIPIEDDQPDSTSMNFRFETSGHPDRGYCEAQRRNSDSETPRVGIIAPVSRPFCGACSRLRITADGKIRPCLFSTREFDVRKLLRNNSNDEIITRFLIDATWTKQSGHNIGDKNFQQPERTMSAIGG